MQSNKWRYFKGDFVALGIIMTAPVNIGIGVGIWQMHDFTGLGPYGLDYSLLWIAIYLIGFIYVKSEYAKIQNINEYEKLVKSGQPAKGQHEQ